MDTKETLLLDGLALVLPPHLTENFEKAENRLKAFYGASPGAGDLIRLWLACATSSRIRQEFERAVLDRQDTTSHQETKPYDEDYL